MAVTTEFDFVVLSAAVGFKKPEEEIFTYCLQQLGGVQPDEVLFLDDREHNTAAASQLGMKTIFVTSPEQAIRDIRFFIETQPSITPKTVVYT